MGEGGGGGGKGSWQMAESAAPLHNDCHYLNARFLQPGHRACSLLSSIHAVKKGDGVDDGDEPMISPCSARSSHAITATRPESAVHPLLGIAVADDPSSTPRPASRTRIATTHPPRRPRREHSTFSPPRIFLKSPKVRARAPAVPLCRWHPLALPQPPLAQMRISE